MWAEAATDGAPRHYLSIMSRRIFEDVFGYVPHRSVIRIRGKDFCDIHEGIVTDEFNVLVFGSVAYPNVPINGRVEEDGLTGAIDAR